jgi:hypothetical protein
VHANTTGENEKASTSTTPLPLRKASLLNGKAYWTGDEGRILCRRGRGEYISLFFFFVGAGRLKAERKEEDVAVLFCRRDRIFSHGVGASADQVARKRGSKLSQEQRRQHREMDTRPSPGAAPQHDGSSVWIERLCQPWTRAPPARIRNNAEGGTAHVAPPIPRSPLSLSLSLLSPYVTAARSHAP